jgi:required for meiotic nuclear division protein 1
MADHASSKQGAVPADTAMPSVDAKALLLGQRIDVRGFEPPDTVTKNPLSFRTGGGLVVVYRFGAVVFVGVAPEVQDEIISALRPRIIEPSEIAETEVVTLAADARGEDAIAASGKISLLDRSDERLSIVANVLAKSVALADDERYMSKVFEQIEPFAQNLAATGGTALASKRVLQLLGESLVAQTRMVGRVEVQEKPDLLWDRPELQRLYARLADEYELDDRARALARKLNVIEETARTLADFTEVRHSVRLEIAIVALIVFEILLTFYNMWSGAQN